MISWNEILRQQKKELARLIEYSGTQARLARELGVSEPTVAGWVHRGRISATAALKVEVITNGIFKKEQLRPDVAKWEK